ncbi:hypothetical protein AB0D67_29145 [Streptosporangium sp. NPDC048047]|uniref:hypothetical protein n=1 Tax=Streptosporangium sp. NPDC048047 TaxID=3155748 RepID=UPI003439344F
MQNPVTREEDRERLSVAPDPGSLLLDLLRRRKDLGLKSKHVAERMGITQQGVYELERKIRNGENVLFSTAVNYAHAVGALLTMEEDPDFTPPPAPPPPPCKNNEACGNLAPKGKRRHGLCSACYNRWHDAGRPERVPPRSGLTPTQAMAEGRRALAANRRAEAHRRFTVLHQDMETIAKDLEVTVNTVKRYLADLSAPDDTAPATT